jgi:hypothetical protein
MLKQKDLALLKALSTMKASPALLQELKKARAAQRRKKALAVARRASSHRESGSTALPSPHLPKQSVGTRKAIELTSTGSSMETATRRPAPRPLSGVGSAPFPATAAGSYLEGSASISAQNPGSTEVKATYAAVVSDSPSSFHPSGTLKTTANGSASSDPAASSEVDTRRMLVCNMPGPLSGMPVGATNPTPQTANPNAVALGERRNRTPVYITGFVIPEVFWHGCGHSALKASQPRWRASGSSTCAFISTEGQVAQSSQEPQKPAYAAVAAGRLQNSYECWTWGGSTWRL